MMDRLTQVHWCVFIALLFTVANFFMLLALVLNAE